MMNESKYISVQIIDDSDSELDLKLDTESESESEVIEVPLKKDIKK